MASSRERPTATPKPISRAIATAAPVRTIRGNGNGVSGVSTIGSIAGSLDGVGNQRNSITNNVGGTADGLLGFNQPIGGDTELGGFGAAGSFTLGSSGRWDMTNGMTLIGGAAFAQQSYSGVDITSASLMAAGLRYTTPRGKALATFIEGGGWAAPGMDVTFSRTYVNGGGTAIGVGTTNGDVAGVYARAGVAWTPKPTREIAVAAAVGHTWTNFAGYAEMDGSSNPFPATFNDLSAQSNYVKAQAQWTEGLTKKLDMTLTGAVGRTFGGDSPVSATITGLGGLSVALADYTFVEYGIRFGYKVSSRDTVDVFAMGVSGEGIGSHFEVGTGFRARL